MKNKNYYEPRFVNQSQGYATNWFGESKYEKTLFEVVLENNKIVLLGNPGAGKTKEMEMLFEKLWNEKDKTGIIPFSINLKNFRKINKFEDLIIYQDWKSLTKVIFILDGLDEIAEIHDFVSAFELFISQTKQLNISYVLSCRTNIFEKYLVNIANFHTFYLQDLTVEQAESLLENKYGQDISKYNLLDKHYNYLKTPFFLELFAGYVLEKGVLPVSDSVMWELFINKILDKQEIKLAKKTLFNRFQLIKNLKKVAFVNELMQQNYSTAAELEEITGNYLEYIGNPFTVELSGEPKRWNFIHRQIQEYFVAKILTERNFEEILSIIKIQNIEKEVIHPSLFNTVTFLINLLVKDSDTFTQLIGWLITNQIEILFKADSDRTESFKEEVFQAYFNKQCVEKKLWISTNRAFTVKEIAEFGDCKENFIYLTDFLIEPKEHFRVIVSALKLLSFFKPESGRLDILRPLFLKLMASEEVEVSIKSEIIRCITSLKICETDQKYLDDVLSIFKTECNKEINAALLFLIYFVKDIDRLFWYIKAEFLRNSNIVMRKEFDDVHRGNDWKLQDLLVRFENSNHFIELVSYYFMDSPSIDFYGEHENDIKNRFLYFSDAESDFIERFLKSVDKKISYYHRDGLLLEIIKESGKQFEAAKILLANNAFSEVRGFISRFVNMEILVHIIEKYYKIGLISSEEIVFFRNNISHYAIVWAVEFERLMTLEGFIFDSAVLDEKQIEEHRKNVLKSVQNNFDILFDSKKLMLNIKKVYDDDTSETLDLDKIYKLSSDWRKKNNYPVYHDSALSVLQSLTDRYGALAFAEVSSYLEDGVFIFKIVLDNLKGNSRENLKFTLSHEQEKELFKWTLATAEKIDFNDLVDILGPSNFVYRSDFRAFKLVLSFQKLFKVPLPKEFLLRSLQFYDIDNFNEKEESFTYLFNEIGDKELFDSKVIDNILNKDLFKYILERHIDYALTNKLSATLPKIREYFLKNNPGYNGERKLELYYELTGDIDLLKECASDVHDPMCWSAVKLLVLAGEEKFCIEKAVEYLEDEESEKRDYFFSNAMWVLFHFNSIKALHYYLKMERYDFHAVNFSDYSIIDDYSTLKILFFRIYKEVFEESRFGYESSFFDTYISNLSKNDDSYVQTQNVLMEIREQLISEKSDTRLFNINLLIDNSKNSYINAKSVPLNFREALKRTVSILA